MGEVQLYRGDCLEILPTLAANSVDAVVTDPPAGIGFMGKEWDHDKGGRDAWVAWLSSVMSEVLRVLKPGGHALVWALPRTSHWTGWALEEAGFEIRDRIAHVFGSGFPKSMNIGKAIDKMAGAEREVIRVESRSQVVGHEGWDRPWKHAQMEKQGGTVCKFPITAPSTPEAQQWDGWGTALKPAMEDWWLCRKPLSEKSIAANVLKWGAGGINVDACRIPTNGRPKREKDKGNPGENNYFDGITSGYATGYTNAGRFPANFTHDGSDEVMALFPVTTSRGHNPRSASNGGIWGNGKTPSLVDDANNGFGDTGSAARFFYCSKASKTDRDEGCEELEERDSTARQVASEWKVDTRHQNGGYKTAVQSKAHNSHPTVKATPLMRWLCRLITPPGGVILDPFMGSGSTGKAAMLEDFGFIGIEIDEGYFKIAERRVAEAQMQMRLGI